MNDEKIIAGMVFAESLDWPDERATLDQRAQHAIFAAGVFEAEWEKHRAAKERASTERHEARLAETRMRKEMEKLQQVERDANDQRLINEVVKAALTAIEAQKAK